MEKFFEDYTADEVIDAVGKIKRLEIRRKEFKILKEKLEKHFNFEITEYIIDDILDYETYYHTCLMINLAVINNRLSAENGEKLKLELKNLFKINNVYDRFDRGVFMGNTFDFDEWYNEYSTKEVINIKKELSKKELQLIEKLGIKLKDKIYTEQEFECLNMELLKYYKDDDMSEEELKYSVKLPEGVTRKEYNDLLDKINEINQKYNF